MAFCSVHKACADALFGKRSRGMALVTGKTMMDRNALPRCMMTPQRGQDSGLYQTWHGKGLALCDCAITSTEARLKVSVSSQIYRCADADSSFRKPRRDCRIRRSLTTGLHGGLWRFGLVNERGVFAQDPFVGKRCRRL
jgi:hypothetical protein